MEGDGEVGGVIGLGMPSLKLDALASLSRLGVWRAGKRSYGADTVAFAFPTSTFHANASTTRPNDTINPTNIVVVCITLKT